MKIQRRPSNVLLPVPLVMVSVAGVDGGDPDIVTLAWVGNVCSAPPMLSISVRPSRHSYGLLQRTHEFVVNVPSRSQAREVDLCGNVSGRDTDKFAACGFHAVSRRARRRSADRGVPDQHRVRHAPSTEPRRARPVRRRDPRRALQRGRARLAWPPAGRQGRPARLRGTVTTGRWARRWAATATRSRSRGRGQGLSRFSITTPIYYVNADPHLGHAYTTIAADILARHHRQLGDDVFFLTGTDEHGNKVAQAAEERGLTPREHVDTLAPRFREMTLRVNAGNDFFIRTTDPEHEAYVQRFVEKLRAAGDIEKRSYGGLYCTACEAFYYERDLVDGQVPGPRHRAGLARRGELLLPAVALPGPAARVLSRATRAGCGRRSRYNEALSFIEGGLDDISHQPQVDHLGHPRAVGPRAGDLRLGRRAHQLRLGAHLRASRRRPRRALLAGRHPPAGQGHPQVPRGDLAGAAVERRLRGAAQRVHPRLPAHGRREDVQDARQRARPVRGDRTARRRRPALLPVSRGDASVSTA